MAAGYFLKLLEQRGIKHIEVRTAGVMTPTGLLPAHEAVHLLQEEGVDIRRHRSRPLSLDMIKRADLVLGMTPFHVQTAFRMTEAARGKTYLLKEYVGRDGKNTQIADPMGGTLEIFKKCFSEIRASLQRLVDMDMVKIPPEQPAEIIEVEEVSAEPAEVAVPAKGKRKMAPEPVTKPKKASKRQPKSAARAVKAAKKQPKAKVKKEKAVAVRGQTKKAGKGATAGKRASGKPAAKPGRPAKAAKPKRAAKPAPANKTKKGTR